MSPEGSSNDLTNVEIVVYVLAELGGGENPVHLERIAERAYAYAPGAFRWDLDDFKSLIDKDKVRVSLTDAQKEKYGALVRAVGARRAGVVKPTDAWQLTPSGMSWCLDHADRIASLLGGNQPALKKGRASELRKRIEQSPLYEEFQKHGRVSENPFALADLLECSPDARNDVFQRKLESLMNQVQLLQDSHLLDFLRACSEAHEDMFFSKGTKGENR